MAMFAVAAFIGNADVTTNRVYSTNHTVGDVEMTPVQQLVYAVKNAPADGVVLIEPGTYTFTGAEYGKPEGAVTNLLYSNKSGVTIIGDTGTSRKDWTLGSEPVIIDINGMGRLFRFESSGCSVRNIAITSSAAPGCTYYVARGGSISSYAVITNCTIRGISGATTQTSILWVALQDCLYTGVVGECRLDKGAVNCDFVDNASQFTYASAYGCTFRGNTTYNTLVTAGGDYKLVGCKFISNTNNNQTIYSADGNLIVEDCEFNDNAAPVCCRSFNTSGKQNDVVISCCKFISNANNNEIILSSDSGLTVEDCEFDGNTASVCCRSYNTSGNSNDVVISGCRFTGNKSILVSASNDTGTNPLNGIVTVTNCLFSSNTASINLPGHYSSSGKHPKVLILGSFGNADKCVVRDSEIVGTRTADSTFGQCALYGARAIRCTFSYDADALPGFSPDWNKYNEAAEASVLEECDISSGELRDCIVDRCTIHDVTNKAWAVFKDYVRVTNTLVRCCKNSGGFYSAPNKLDAEFVNCTIVSNDVITFDFQWATASTNCCRFVNSLFNGNCRTTTATDFFMRDNDKALHYWNYYVEFSNTYYGTFTANGRLSKKVFDAKKGENLLSECVDPKFVKDSRPDAPYWSLLLKSPLIGKGDPLDFSASDLDLAGKARLKDGKIDIGCYQCWLNPAGLILIVR